MRLEKNKHYRLTSGEYWLEINVLTAHKNSYRITCTDANYKAELNKLTKLSQLTVDQHTVLEISDENYLDMYDKLEEILAQT